MCWEARLCEEVCTGQLLPLGAASPFPRNPPLAISVLPSLAPIKIGASGPWGVAVVVCV